MFNFTVIIPHKDIPELLQRAIDSVPQRDDLQLIIVDDNSDPSKVNFDYFPGTDRPNTQIILTKEGRGAGYARNIGLKKAQGKWLLFADADDMFTSDIESILNNVLELEDKDLIYFNSIAIDLTSGEVDKSFIHTIRIKEACSGINNDIRYRVNAPWGKIISHELLTNSVLRFDETLCFNDWMFSVKLANMSKSFGLIETIGYVYSYRQTSLTYQADIKTELCRLQVAKRVRKYSKHYGIKCQFESADTKIIDTIKRIKEISKPNYYKELIKEGLATGKIFQLIARAIKSRWNNR